MARTYLAVALATSIITGGHALLDAVPAALHEVQLPSATIPLHLATQLPPVPTLAPIDSEKIEHVDQDIPSQVESIFQGIGSGLVSDAHDVTNAFNAYLAVLTSATVSSQAPEPTSFGEVTDILEDIFLPVQPNGSGNPARGSVTATGISDLVAQATSLGEPQSDGRGVSIFEDAMDFILNGLSPKYNEGIIESLTGKSNSFNNDNPNPPYPIYPQKAYGDAPYDVSEDDLRSAIFIPDGFTYGQKQPVILFPGTGSDGGDNFAGNLIPLMLDGKYDIVWVNVPGYMLGDAQTNAEYAAYAINYIYSITNGRKAGIVSWSQGGLSNQWALKYWPSTREAVADFIPVSPDFKGTVMAYYLCPGFPKLPCDPSVLQQIYYSNFINALRGSDGDSAYVPTTTIYSSIFDEIVQPQTGQGASAYLEDVRQVGVTNNEVQAICPGRAAGGFYTHESLLTNALTYALILDALDNDGPGDINRIDLENICDLFIADGLSELDLLATEAVIPQAAINLLAYFPKYFNEPAVKAYAR